MDDSPFAKLSPELRNRIWDLVVAKQKPINFDANANGHTAAVQPRITRVWRQTRGESLPVFYHGNVFAWPRVPSKTFCPSRTMAHLINWLKTVPRSQHEAVKQLQIFIDGEDKSINGDSPSATSTWSELRTLLQSRGYSSPRLGVHVVMRSSSSNLNEGDYAERAVAKIKDRLGYLGSDTDVVKCLPNK